MGSGARAPTDYDFVGHLNRVFRAYPTPGRLCVLAAALMVAVCVGAWVRRRREEPAAPAALFAALALLYLATPKAFSGAWLVHVRLPQ